VTSRHRAQTPLLYWAKEREAVRKRKLAGDSSPWTGAWTDDPILRKYRFCNVRRKDDRVSQWLIENVLSHAADFDNHGVFLKWVALCRWVNWPPTLSDVILGDEFVTYDTIDLPRIGQFIEERKGTGSKSWTGAYMVRAPSKKRYPGVTKGQFVAETVVGGLDTVMDKLLRDLQYNSCEEVWRTLCSVPNWGSFMAGQVVADLTYTPFLEKAFDLYTWAPQGPGSRRGFNRLLGRPLYAPVPDTDWAEYLPAWRGMLVEELGLSDMTLHDVQNCLCETDKYLRVQAGEGRPRSTYKPETAY